MTANPNWKEIKDHLATYGGDSPNDRPDIECRVFKMKLDHLMEDFKKGTFFKPYTAALHRIEFQKRGLPHAHILLWFGNTSRTPSPEEVDRIISAELRNKELDPEAFNLVTKHMMHGPCGVIKPGSPCMENNLCTKKFPRPYNEHTSIDKSGYVLYRRRRDEHAFLVKDGVLINNTSVIPHNIEILKKYEAHINVEWCNRTSAVKYLFKYITKGVDRVCVVLEGKNTSSSSEIHKRKPSVQKLIIHLEGEHNITVKESDNLGRVLRKPGIEKTMFTEWMVLCQISEFARTFTYVQIPEYFTWNNNTKVWSEHKGPRNYEEIRTYNDVIYPDFKSACVARSFLDNDIKWHETMAKSALFAPAYQLCDMFVTFWVYNGVDSPKELWERCWKSMSDDILYKKQATFAHKTLELDDAQLEKYTLIEVEKIMRTHEKSLNDFTGIPKINPDLIKQLGNSLCNQEVDYDVGAETKKHDIQYGQLHNQQLEVYEAVISSVENNEGKLFFVNGAGGAGKTFLYQTIISRLRSRKHIVLLVASSGIAALLLPNGRTAHSRFNIPIDLTEETFCRIKPGTMLSELIHKTDLIIWDEAPMTHKHAFEALDRTLKDIMSSINPEARDKTFGGKTVLLGGDFRQVLPVILQGSRTETILASISQSHLWESCVKITLKTNMRVSPSEREFSDWVLQVGEGTAPTAAVNDSDEHHSRMITLDKTLVEEITEKPLIQVVESTYGELGDLKPLCTDKAILTPRNETVDKINAYTIAHTSGVAKEYFSSDSFEISETHSKQNDTLYAVEYLNTLEFPGLPTHMLKLKVGAQTQGWCSYYASKEYYTKRRLM